jgi:hypothetical protein
MRGKNPPIILTLYISVLGDLLAQPATSHHICRIHLSYLLHEYSSKQYMGASNRVGIGLLYRPIRLHSQNWFLGIESWAS